MNGPARLGMSTASSSSKDLLRWRRRDLDRGPRNAAVGLGLTSTSS